MQRHDAILNSRATDSRVKDRSFELGPLPLTPLQLCLGGEGEPALDRSLVWTELTHTVGTQVMGLSFLKGDQSRSEVRSFRDLITLDRIIQGTT